MNRFAGIFLFFLNILAISVSTKYQRLNSSSPRYVPINNENSALTWSNGSAIQLNSSLHDDDGFKAIDCFGLGSTVAQTLQWLFVVQRSRAIAEDVRFFFSSRKQPRRVHLVTGTQFGLEWTDFNVERRTVFIVHGFLSDSGQSWVTNMEEAFLLWGDVNVVVVDWSARGNSFNYLKAVVNTRTVGSEIARLLHHIVNATIIASSPDEPKWGSLHLVGHSLGAHICGFAASEFKRRQNKWNVSRITGLDPANRCFNNVSASLRLSTDDASFVDVIHTNGRLDEWFAFGSPQSIGHVDFYPNGGKRQPACVLEKGLMSIPAVLAPKGFLQQAICNHGHSYLYFTDSLISASTDKCIFWAHHWDRSYRRAVQLLSETCDANNCTEMGIRAENHPHRGTFFVITSRTSPFCVTDGESKDELRQQLEIDYANEILD